MSQLTARFKVCLLCADCMLGCLVSAQAQPSHAATDLEFFREADGGDQDAPWTPALPPAPGYVELAGEVASIHGRELTLTSAVKVDTSQMRDNPLDEHGYPRVRVGDHIKVGGRLRADLTQRTEVIATWVAKFCVDAEPDCEWRK